MRDQPTSIGSPTGTPFISVFVYVAADQVGGVAGSGTERRETCVHAEKPDDRPTGDRDPVSVVDPQPEQVRSGAERHVSRTPDRSGRSDAARPIGVKSAPAPSAASRSSRLRDPIQVLWLDGEPECINAASRLALKGLADVVSRHPLILVEDRDVFGHEVVGFRP